MTPEEIIEMIREAWDNHVFANTSESILGLNCWIEGKNDFINELSDKIIKSL